MCATVDAPRSTVARLDAHARLHSASSLGERKNDHACWMSSLPLNGLDGTLRRSRATPGRAHLKTGSLRDVAGIAGYVLSDSGRRYVLVALINHPNANAGRPALDALVQWAIRDAPTK